MDPLDKVGGARAELALDARKFGVGIEQGISGINRLDSASRKMAPNVKGSFATVGTSALIAGAAIAAAVGSAILTFGNFEKAMNAVRAVSGATGEQFDQLRLKALQIGKDTVFSATEAAGAMEELAKAGVSVKDILSGAADGAVALAAAAGESIPIAAAQMAEAINIFKLSGDQAMHVADLYAAAASKTNASSAEIAEGISNASAVFTLLGIPVETAVGVMGLFNDQAIKGAEAGTALKSTMLALLTPTQQQADLMDELNIHLFDAQGNFVGMDSLAQQLKDSLSGLTQEQRTLDMAILGGSYGIRGLNVLYQAGADTVDDYTEKVDDAGAAAEQAAMRNAGLNGSLEQLRGSIETAKINFGEGLAPAIESVAGWLREAADAFASLSPETQATIGKIAVATAGLLLFLGAGIKVVMMGKALYEGLIVIRGALIAASGAEAAAAATTGGLAVAETGAAAASFSFAAGLEAVAVGLGSVLLAAAPVAAAIAGAVIIGQSIKVNAQGPEGGPSWADAIAQKSENALGRAFDSLGANTFGDWLKHDADETMSDQELFKQIGDLGFNLKTSLMGGFLTKTSETTIEELGISVKELQDYADQAGISIDEALLRFVNGAHLSGEAVDNLREKVQQARVEAKKIEDMKLLTPSGGAHGRFAGPDVEILTPEARAEKQANEEAARAIDDHNIAVAQAIAAAHDKIDTDAIETEAQAALNAEYLKATGLLLPYTRGAEDVAKATAEFNKTLDEEVRGVAASNSGLIDLSASLPGLQAGYGRVGDSIFRMVLLADKAGDLDLSNADRNALRLADNLSKTEANIDRVSAAIANNQGDLSMWQGRLDLVDGVLGSSEDTLAEWEQQLAIGAVTQDEFNAAVSDGRAVRAFDNLKDLLDEGRISQKEYDEILESGWWLHERSLGGIEDEKAEIAKLIPDLAEYVRQHDDDNRALKDLDPAQRGRIAALQQEGNAAILNTAIMVKMLEAMGQIPADKSTALLLDLTQFSPEMKGALEDYGFFDDPKTGVVNLEVNWAGKEAWKNKDSVEGIGDVPAIVTPPADTTATDQSLDDLATNAAAKGTESGEALDDGFKEGSSGLPQTASAAGASAIDALNADDQGFYNSGWNDGYNYDAGLIAGLQYLSAEIYNQAKANADLVVQASRDAHESHSPSQKARDVAADWNAGMALEFASDRSVENAARKSAERVTWASRRGFGADAGGFMGSNAGAGYGPSASAQPTVIMAGHRIGDLVIAPVFQGITDTGEILNEIRVGLADGLDQLEAMIA